MHETLSPPSPGLKSALQCLAFLADRFHMPFDAEALLDSMEPGLMDLDAGTLARLAEAAGFKAHVDTVDPASLAPGLSREGFGYPLLAVLHTGACVIVAGTAEDQGRPVALIIDPSTASPKPLGVALDELARGWDGEALFIKPHLGHPLLRAFLLLARHHGCDLSLDGVLHQYALGQEDPSQARFIRLAREQGFKVARKSLSWDRLAKVGEAFPCIALGRDGGVGIMCGFLDDPAKPAVDMVDPLQPQAGHKAMSREEYEAAFTGEAYFIKRCYGLTEEEQPFGLRWFIPEFLRQKRVFMDVGLLAVMMLIIALATPLFFQIVIDKVLVHYSFSTLHMLAIGLLAALIFDAGFNYLRGYLLLHGASKIDIRVSTRTLARLVSLPMGFFDHAASGVLIKHMQQAEKIRNFLTGKLFMTLLDSLALFVFLPVLLFYSWKLTLVVVGFSALIALCIALIIPTFRRRLKELYMAEGERQAFLVETIQGMHTVKSLSLEPLQRKEWDDKAAKAVGMNFRVGKISTTARAVTQFLDKAMSLAVIWWGVYMVFAGDLTVGALIAFRMLAGHVSSPLVQIVSLINEYQETALSVKMLGTIMNQPPERAVGARGLVQPIRGGVAFERVSFRYTPDGAPVLVDVNLAIPSGTMIGVVGRSGSGKSTLTRLLQALYPSQEGVVRVDGLDIRDIDLVHLRRNIGVVLQENFLFHGTVRQNIAMTKPSATFEEIVSASRLAGADEFIERLPQGFDTMLEENAANLSGGQKQRLAIARALLTQPRILIFDEATSALDAESEEIIQDNIGKIAKGRTLIIISHRLSMLVKADSIVVMEKGRIVDNAPHQVLLARCEPYAKLWRSQNRHLEAKEQGA